MSRGHGQLEGKVALVTGGARGIGAACARTLAREGAKVAISDINDIEGEAMVAEIRKAEGEAVFLHQDVTVEARWPEVMAEIERRYARLDVLVANAGIALRMPLVEMPLADWRRQQAVNLDGVFLSIKHAIPAMRRSGGGSIVVMSSVAGLRGSPGLAGYCATKGGVRLLTKAVAMECALASDGIRVNSVHPGIIDTLIWAGMSTGGDAARRNAPTDVHELARHVVPMARAGEAQDIANTVLFLASDASSYMTGAELVVDGGIVGGGGARRP